jgi:hypothetical protein
MYGEMGMRFWLERAQRAARALPGVRARLA